MHVYIYIQHDTVYDYLGIRKNTAANTTNKWPLTANRQLLTRNDDDLRCSAGDVTVIFILMQT
jgi:hypothetical protein